MKKLLTFIFLSVAGTVPAFAQWAVFDVASLQQSITNYSALTRQIANQASQISNQVLQIRQFETQLQRMGDMANVKKLIGFPEFQLDLKLPTKIKTWSDSLKLVDDRV